MSRSFLVVSGSWCVALALTVGLSFVPQASATSPPVAAGELIAGVARVLDGDTLELTGRDGRVVKVRLEGIDAPEGGQRCNRRWGLGTWDCGLAATHALRLLAEERDVTCRTHGIDRFERVLGFCRIADRDINAELVRAGLAWAFVRYSTIYVADEQLARNARRGIWQGETPPAWEWRAQQKPSNGSGQSSAVQPSQPTPRLALAAPPPPPRAAVGQSDGVAPVGCEIKGAVTRNGRIYHTPESPWYERVRMSLGMGRRWFCTEQEAEAAGWRPTVRTR